jgi:hypothetical protein
VSTFRGVTISIHWNDHPPPHFHASHAGADLVIEIDTLTIFRGRLPRKMERRVLSWAASHLTELQQAWDDVEEGRRPELIIGDG